MCGDAARGVCAQWPSVLAYVPLKLSEALGWRELRRSRGFALPELVPDSVFSARAADRGPCLRIADPFKELGVRGLLQPVAFATGGNPHDFANVAPSEPRMTLREEEPAKELRAPRSGGTWATRANRSAVVKAGGCGYGRSWTRSSSDCTASATRTTWTTS